MYSREKNLKEPRAYNKKKWRKTIRNMYVCKLLNIMLFICKYSFNCSIQREPCRNANVIKKKMLEEDLLSRRSAHRNEG